MPKALAGYLTEQSGASGNLEMTTAPSNCSPASRLSSQSAKGKSTWLFDAEKRGLVVKLRDLKLVEEFAGVDGRLRFATTADFLQRFGLASVGELAAASLSGNPDKIPGTKLLYERCGRPRSD